MTCSIKLCNVSYSSTSNVSIIYIYIMLCVYNVYIIALKYKFTWCKTEDIHCTDRNLFLNELYQFLFHLLIEAISKSHGKVLHSVFL